MTPLNSDADACAVTGDDLLSSVICTATGRDIAPVSVLSSPARYCRRYLNTEYHVPIGLVLQGQLDTETFGAGAATASRRLKFIE
jgi:hypothetical protein